MKKIIKLLSTFTLGILYSTLSLAQEPKWCGTDEMTAKSLNANPQLVQEYLAEQIRLEKLDQTAFALGYPEQSQRGPVYTIPIVFHILHQNGPENISDDQIFDAVRILNEDFSKTNADISKVVSAFQGITGNPELQFVLAKKDPNGNCTNGIDRIVSAETNIGDDGSMINTWDRSKYLNVYVVKTISSGAAGYTRYPGTSSPEIDAIMILNTYVGSIGTGSLSYSRALTHEIGHWFNVKHVWGDSNQPGVACGDDAVGDTPITKGHLPGNCNLTDKTCTSGVVENVQNYMEYAYCQLMYTVGQATRIRNAAVSSTGQRNNLWTTANLAATGVSTPLVLCKADFKTNSTTNTLCQGNSLTFSDQSWNGVATAWNWSFPGGTPATSTAQSPVVQYNTPGNYGVTLTASNASGTVTATKSAYVIVNATPGLNGVYSDNFEGATIPNVNWQVNNVNGGSATWAQTNTAAVSGTKSIRILNAATYTDFIDELISQPINITTTGTSPKIIFKVAHAQKTATTEDKLTMLLSTNCGKSWNQAMILKGASLATAPIQSTSFVPTSTQWVTKTISLNGIYATATNLMVMFRFTSDGGNNIYIDDINIGGTISGVGIEDELTNTLNFNVYPNPVESNSIITFTLLDKQNVDIKLMDVIGREIASVYTGSLNAGDYQYAIADKKVLTSGIYLVKLKIDNHLFTKKLIVK